MQPFTGQTSVIKGKELVKPDPLQRKQKNQKSVILSIGTREQQRPPEAWLSSETCQITEQQGRAWKDCTVLLQIMHVTSSGPQRWCKRSYRPGSDIRLGA